MSETIRHIQALSCQDAGFEDPALTRERLKERFPKGATRRMTQLGLLVGSSLAEIAPQPGDAIVYASGYGESRALEGFLDSFPTASPTQFQTSIHPSAVQQLLIGRQHPVGEFFPMTGRAHLVAQAVQAALLAPAPRVLLCGGEERGTWLLEHRAASDRSFGFAVALSASGDAAAALGQLRLISAEPDAPVAAFTLPDFFTALLQRTAIDLVAAPGWRLQLAWR